MSYWPLIPRGVSSGRASVKLRYAVVVGVLAGFAFGAPAGAIARSDGAGRPLMLAGLQRPVRVGRDGLGVPHVYARSDHDAFFANGYLQAQDRFFQMDVAQFLLAAGGGRDSLGGA